MLKINKEPNQIEKKQKRNKQTHKIIIEAQNQSRAPGQMAALCKRRLLSQASSLSEPAGYLPPLEAKA